jgi:outer membrane biosynthesis protein TonB
VVPTSFSSAAALPPSIDDLDAALHRNARQRRVVFGAIGGAVAVVALAFGVMATKHHEAPAPSVAAAAVVAPPPVVPAPAPAPPPVVTPPPPPAPAAAVASAAPEAPAVAKSKKHKGKRAPKAHSPKLTKVTSGGT